MEREWPDREQGSEGAAGDAVAEPGSVAPLRATPDEFLESIFASMADGLVLFDAKGRMTSINPAAREMLGMDLRARTGAHAPEPAGTTRDEHESDAALPHLRVVDIEGRPLARERLPVIAALRGEALRGIPLAFLKPGGSKVWATVGAIPIRAPDGTIAGAVLSLGDVTRLRDLQEQREDLARMISHDLRAPLGVILGQARLLGRRAEPVEATRARIDAIVTSAQRMASMLNDLVESALLEAGKLRLDLAPVNVAELIRDLRQRLATPFDGERVRIEVAPGVPLVLGDAERLERVLVNLLTNALKYSAPASEVAVRIRSDAEAVTIEVEDHGQGIAAEDVPHLFERYFRASGAFRFEGMGLGLYTARMLVEAHGGTIEVSSVAGEGSVFHVRLPLRRER